MIMLILTIEVLVLSVLAWISMKKAVDLERENERLREIIKNQDHHIAELHKPFPDNPIINDYLKSKSNEKVLPDSFVKHLQSCFKAYVGLK